MAAEGQSQAPLDRGGRSRHPGCPPVVWTVTTGANTWPSRCSALRGVGRAEQAQEAVVHGVGGFLGGHPAGLDLFFGGAAKGQAGGQQPAGGQGGRQGRPVLAPPDELPHRTAAGGGRRGGGGGVAWWAGVAGGRCDTKG